MMDQSISPKDWHAVVGSLIQAAYEVVFVLVPVIVWAVVLLSIGSSYDEIYKLPSWPFASLALFCATLRDGISAFHQDNLADKRERELLVLASLIGVVLSSVLLTLAVLHARGQIPSLWSIFYQSIWVLLGAGIALLLVTKAIMLQRKNYGRYV